MKRYGNLACIAVRTIAYIVRIRTCVHIYIDELMETACLALFQTSSVLKNIYWKELGLLAFVWIAFLGLQLTRVRWPAL
jgi:hypothetical protein